MVLDAVKLCSSTKNTSMTKGFYLPMKVHRVAIHFVQRDTEVQHPQYIFIIFSATCNSGKLAKFTNATLLSRLWKEL